MHEAVIVEEHAVLGDLAGRGPHHSAIGAHLDPMLDNFASFSYTSKAYALSPRKARKSHDGDKWRP
jgi:hypothetical protein